MDGNGKIKDYIEDNRQGLEGSPAFDAWKRAHKEAMSKYFYGTDIDQIILEYGEADTIFALLVNRHQFPVAIMDFKEASSDHSVKEDRWSTAVIFNTFLSIGIPCFRIIAVWHPELRGLKNEFTSIKIEQIEDADAPAGTYKTVCIKQLADLEAYANWEGEWRRQRYFRISKNGFLDGLLGSIVELARGQAQMLLKLDQLMLLLKGRG